MNMPQSSAQTRTCFFLSFWRTRSSPETIPSPSIQTQWGGTTAGTPTQTRRMRCSRPRQTSWRNGSERKTQACAC